MGSSGSLARCYAGVPARAMAMTVDCVLVSLATFVAAVPVSVLLGPAVRFNEFADSAAEAVTVDHGIAAVDAALGVAISALYFVGSWRRRRATPGQRLFGLLVTSDDGGASLRLPAALARWAALWAPLAAMAVLSVTGAPGWSRSLVVVTAALWYAYLLISTARDPLKRGAHDRWASSVVTTELVPVTWAEPAADAG